MSLNDILKKISQAEKTELSKHEIELASLQDIDKSIEEGRKYSQQGFDFEKKALGTIVDSIDSRRASLVKYNEALSNANDVIKKLRDIGIDDRQVADKIKLINRYISETNQSIKSLQSINF